MTFDKNIKRNIKMTNYIFCLGSKFINLFHGTGLLRYPLKTEKQSLLMFSRGMGTRWVNGCVRYIFASLFLGLNENTSQVKKNMFYFTSKPLFVFEKIKF